MQLISGVKVSSSHRDFGEACERATMVLVQDGESCKGGPAHKLGHNRYGKSVHALNIASSKTHRL